jgi:lysophospholipase L1-like esterase
MRLFPLLITAALVLSPLHVRAEILVKTGETVAFLGDSITGQGTATPGGYVRLVESGLATNGVAITVIPAGASGHKSTEMLARLEKDVLSKKPTWMTLSCGVNDVMHNERGVPLEDYKRNITEILDRCQQAGIKVMVLTATQIYLPVTNEWNTKLVGYNDFLRETAKARNLPLADLNAAMAAEQAAFEKAGTKRSLTFDGVHMSIYGNLMMAKGVLAAFGLNAEQIAAAEARWKNIPEVFQTNAKLKLTLNDLAALEAHAASQNKTVEAVLNEVSTEAVNALIKTR